MAATPLPRPRVIGDLFLDGITWHLLLGAPSDALVVQPDMETTA